MTFRDEQIAALTADLNRANVKQRKQAGRQLSYIEGWWAEAEANRIFGHHAWDSETIDLRMVAEKPRKIGDAGVDGWAVSYICRVRVTVTTPTGHEIVREGIGAGHGIDRDLGLAHESAAKEAETDAEKRALKTFGNPFGLALYDKTQAHVSDAPAQPISRETAKAIGDAIEPVLNEDLGRVFMVRKSSAQAKRDGDDKKVKDGIAMCDLDGLRDWHTRFDEYTATLPLSWLDSVRDMLEHRLEELNAPPNPEAEAMDDAFRNTVGGGRPPGLPRNGSAVEAA